MTVLPQCRVPSEPPVPCAIARSQFLHLQFRMRLAAQLTHRLDDLGDAAAIGRMVAAQSTAVGVERQLADTGDQVAVGDELAALALLAEAQILKLHQHGDGEAVVYRGVFDVGRLDARHLPRGRTGPARRGIGQIDVATRLVLWRFADADDLHQRPLQALGDLRLGDDERAAAVADDAAIQPVQGGGDHRRAHHVLHRHHVLQHGVRVVLRVMRGGDLDPGELLAGGAVFMHVAHRAHRVHVGGGGAVRVFELHLRLSGAAGARRGAGGHALAARTAGQGDQRDAAAAGGDGLQCVADGDLIGRTSDIGGIHVTAFQVHVVDHGQRAEAWGIAGAVIAVDVVLGEAGILQRALGALGMEQGHRFIGGLARRMLVGTDDVARSLQTHAFHSLRSNVQSGSHGAIILISSRAARRRHMEQTWPQ